MKTNKTIKVSLLAATIALSLTGCKNDGASDDTNSTSGTIAINKPVSPMLHPTEKPNDEEIKDLGPEKRFPDDVHVAQGDGIKIEMVQPLPETTLRGKVYDITIAVTNNTRSVLHDYTLEVLDRYHRERLNGFMSELPTVSVGETRLLHGQYRTDTHGQATLNFVFQSSFNNHDLNLTTSTETALATLTANITKPLPKVVKTNSMQLPFEATFTNDGTEQMAFYPSIESYGEIVNPKLDAESERHFVLEAGETATIKGTVDAIANGFGRLILYIDNLNGPVQSLDFYSNVTDSGVVVKKTIEQPYRFLTNHRYPFAHTLENVSDEPIKVDHFVTVIGQVDYEITKNDCKGKTLQPEERCAVEGSFKPVEARPFTLRVQTTEDIDFTGTDYRGSAVHAAYLQPITIGLDNTTPIFNTANHGFSKNLPKNGAYTFTVLEDLQDRSVVDKAHIRSFNKQERGNSHIIVNMDGVRVPLYMHIKNNAAEDGTTMALGNHWSGVGEDKLDNAQNKTLYAYFLKSDFDMIPEGEHEIPLVLSLLQQNGYETLNYEITLKFDNTVPLPPEEDATDVKPSASDDTPKDAVANLVLEGKLAAIKNAETQKAQKEQAQATVTMLERAPVPNIYPALFNTVLPTILEVDETQENNGEIVNEPNPFDSDEGEAEALTSQPTANAKPAIAVKPTKLDKMIMPLAEAGKKISSEIADFKEIIKPKNKQQQDELY